MRGKGLLYKLIITFTLILGMVLICLALLLSMWFKGNYFTQKRTQFEQCGQYISTVVRSCDKGKESIAKLQSVVDISSVTIDASIVLGDASNRAHIISQNDKNTMKISHIELIEKNIEQLKKGKSVEYAKGHYTFIYPIIENKNFMGAIIMTTPLSIINEQLHKIYLIIWISALGAMILSSVVLSVFSKRILINPLAEINNAARKVANGDVNHRVSITSNDEVGELASSFNIMAESLEKVENNRRDFISNVSHELRSPITSIKGFIAGIIDGVIPKDKEKYYLEIVYSEVKRLTRLINDLLDLSAIESGKLKFNIRKFDINELIRLCVINNEGKIKEKGIIISIDLQKDNCYVSADEDKVIQVITNLLDNAVKYCGDDGEILIKTHLKGPKVFVAIYNNGPSLTEEENLHIWDRFYKSDKSRTNKVSTGLGLSIVRMLLLKQGEEIWVRNDKKRGVTFTFSLTRSK